jgi:hypothetical protein
LSNNFTDLKLLLPRFRVPLQVVGLWVILRIITSVWTAIVSSLSPLTEIEKAIPLWPPSAPISDWLERALLAPWNRWDDGFYLQIVTEGYQTENGTAQFHPLYPWLATPLANIGLHPLFSLLLVSSAAGLTMLLLFQRLAGLDFSAGDARVATLMLLFFPSALVLFAPYTEGLFLLFSVLCLYFARQRTWLLAGLAGGLATLTRQQGLFLALPLGWEIWEAYGGRLLEIFKQPKSWLGLSLIPAGMLAWLGYRAIALDDLSPDFTSVHSAIYSVIISPSSTRVVPASSFIWPWQALWYAIGKAISAPDIDIWINLILAGVFLVLLGLAWRNMRASYRIYSLAIVLTALSFYTGPFHPYMGLPRHLWLAFPVFIGLAPLVRRPWMRLAAAGSGLVGMLFLLLSYVFHAWVP